MSFIGGVMVSVLASNAVDRGFEPWSGQTKDYEMGICCFSAKHATLRRLNNNYSLNSIAYDEKKSVVSFNFYPVYFHNSGKYLQNTIS